MRESHDSRWGGRKKKVFCAASRPALSRPDDGKDDLFDNRVSHLNFHCTQSWSEGLTITIMMSTPTIAIPRFKLRHHRPFTYRNSSTGPNCRAMLPASSSSSTRCLPSATGDGGAGGKGRKAATIHAEKSPIRIRCSGT